MTTAPLGQRCEALLQRNSRGFLMVTATPEGKIPKRKSQITNKSKITNSNSKTESKIWRCDRSNSSEIKRRSIHGVLF